MGKTQEQIELDIDGKRRCIMCNDIKSKTEDFRIKRYHYNQDGSIKYTTYESRCKKCMSTYSREMKIRSPEVYCKNIIKSIRHRAKELNIPFDLTASDLFCKWNDQNGLCYYSGEILDLTLTNPNHNAPHRLFPSVDRQDPKLGYISGNVVWCAYVVNRMKSDLSHKEFVNLCKIILDKFDNG